MVPDWVTLQGAIDGEVALPSSPLYERIYKPFNARFHEVQPSAIVLCATPQDVSEAILFLNRTGLESTIRNGTNYDRLVQVKAQYDPTGFFRFHQSLPVR